MFRTTLYFFNIIVGRYTAQDIAVFARDTFTSKVFTLGPESFPNPVTAGEDNWFVDFFAPVRPVHLVAIEIMERHFPCNFVVVFEIILSHDFSVP